MAKPTKRKTASKKDTTSDSIAPSRPTQDHQEETVAVGNWNKRAVVARNINTGVYDVKSSQQRVPVSPTSKKTFTHPTPYKFTTYTALLALIAALYFAMGDDTSVFRRVRQGPSRSTTTTLATSSRTTVASTTSSAPQSASSSASIASVASNSTATLGNSTATLGNGTATTTTGMRNTTTSSIQTTPTEEPEPEPEPCEPGVEVGRIIMVQPNTSSTLFVGLSANVSWKYDNRVERSLIKYITINYLMFGEALSKVGESNLIANFSVKSDHKTWVLWNVPNVNDGSFRIRISANGLDTEVIRAKDPFSDLPCIPNGFPYQAMTGRFKIQNPVANLPVYPDRHGPNSLSIKMNPNYAFLLVCILIGILAQ